MEDDAIVSWIIEVIMLLPVGEIMVDLDVSIVRGSTNPDFRVAEVGTSISVRNADVDDLDTLTVEGFQLIDSEILVSPDEVEKSLVDMPGCSHGILSGEILSQGFRFGSIFPDND